MKKLFITFIILSSSIMYGYAGTLSGKLSGEIFLKNPGNPAVSYALQEKANGELVASQSLPVSIRQQVEEVGSYNKVTVNIRATQDAWFNFQYTLQTGMNHSECLFYMPGFWYRKNLRSPKEAPSFHTSDSWQVREDRLSAPMTGVFNESEGNWVTVLRMDEFKEETISQHSAGEVILTGKTSIGYTGFNNQGNKTDLVFGFPYHEAPKTYIRKLTLAPDVQAFQKLAAGESVTLTWFINKGKSEDYSQFVAQTWINNYDLYTPQPVVAKFTPEEAKKVMTNYFHESYVDKHEIDYFAGVHLYTNTCQSTGRVEVGFVGRVLLNAFNALEYGELNGDGELVRKANSIFDSYLAHGFTPNGFFREFINYDDKNETEVYSIRRQSEGLFAIMNYLEYEKRQGRKHPEWEQKMKHLIDNFLLLQNADGSFPRKFDDKCAIVDGSGGSTPSATLPLTMAYTYFKDKKSLESARKTADYLENELISKADYFSSTLDANCEDKEASLYASTAMYYMAMVTKGKERERYIDLSMKSAWFALSWYYLYDVPFAPGQMLGDVNFLSRGWGNVSVENNHIDVFIFEFATVLDWLAKERGEARLAKFSEVIKTSMLQLMPVEGSMFDIAKVGYYPEVVQHTHWDYGRNGKGFYNDLFAPGWTIASLWQMLSPDRVENYFNPKKK